MSRTPRPRGMMINLLPAHLREELRALEAARDDESVSAEDWHRRADILMGRAASMPAPIRDAFNRAVRGLARDERDLERRTGRLVGLPDGVDEAEVRAQEADLRRRVKAGELSADEADVLRRRLGKR